jgi:hypothetical protein
MKDQFTFVRKDEKQHIISGIVLSPDDIDEDEEFAAAEDIEQASINYMINYRKGYTGNTISHTQYLDYGKVTLIENYIAPVDLKLGISSDDTIKKGSWIQSYKIHDAEIWDMIMEGKIVGFSMGADVYKTPIEREV